MKLFSEFIYRMPKKGSAFERVTHEVIRPTEAISIPGLGQLHIILPPIRDLVFLIWQLLLPFSGHLSTFSRSVFLNKIDFQSWI